MPVRKNTSFNSEPSPSLTLGVVLALTIAAVVWFVLAQAEPRSPLPELPPQTERLAIRDGDHARDEEGASRLNRRGIERVVVQRSWPPSETRYEPELPPRRFAQRQRFGERQLTDSVLEKLGVDVVGYREVEEYRDTILHDPDPEERADAILLLSGNDHPGARRTFIAAMKDPNPRVRLAAVEALSDYAEVLRPHIFGAALRDRNADVRFEAFSIIGEMEGPAPVRLLRLALRDPDKDVRSLAASELAFRRNHR